MTAIPLLVPTISFRGAYTDDVAVMTRMINGYAAVGLMRPRNPEELLRRLEEFVVATEVDGSVAACGGLRADGFRRAENQCTALEGELYFYGQVFGFSVDVAPAGVTIHP